MDNLLNFEPRRITGWKLVPLTAATLLSLVHAVATRVIPGPLLFWITGGHWALCLYCPMVFYGLIWAIFGGSHWFGRWGHHALLGDDNAYAGRLGFNPDRSLSGCSQLFHYWFFDLIRPFLNWLDNGHTYEAALADKDEVIDNVWTEES